MRAFRLYYQKNLLSIYDFCDKSLLELSLPLSNRMESEGTCPTILLVLLGFPVASSVSILLGDKFRLCGRISCCAINAKPYRAITFKSGPECNLQHSLSGTQAHAIANVIHLVPDGRGRGIAICVQGMPGGLDVLG